MNSSPNHRAARRRMVLVGAAALVVMLTTGAAGVANAASAAGTSATVAPATWTKRVCTAVGQWRTRVDAAGPRAATSDPVAARDSLSASLGQAVIATDDLVRGLRAAGEPKVAHGREIAASLVSTFTRVRAQLAAAARRASRLPTSSASAFATGAAAVERTLAQTMSDADTALAKAGTRYPSKVLDRAFASAAACSTS